MADIITSAAMRSGYREAIASAGGPPALNATTATFSSSMSQAVRRMHQPRMHS